LSPNHYYLADFGDVVTESLATLHYDYFAASPPTPLPPVMAVDIVASFGAYVMGSAVANSNGLHRQTTLPRGRLQG
jgi:hypothetical protein